MKKINDQQSLNDLREESDVKEIVMSVEEFGKLSPMEREQIEEESIFVGLDVKTELVHIFDFVDVSDFDGIEERQPKAKKISWEAAIAGLVIIAFVIAVAGIAFILVP